MVVKRKVKRSSVSRSSITLSKDMADRVLKEMEKSLEINDLSGAAKFLVLYNSLAEVGELDSLPKDFQLKWSTLVENTKEKLRDWRSKLTENDTIEFLNGENAWYLVKLISKPVNNIATVHFLGWDKKYDQEVDLSCEFTVLPPHTLVTGRKRNNAVEPTTSSTVTGTEESLPSVEETTSTVAPTTATTTTVTEESIVSSRSARLLGRQQQEQPIAEKRSRRTKNNDNTNTNNNNSGIPEKKSSKRAVNKEEKDHNDWVCTVCNMLEAPRGTDLLMCDGPCHRSFHYECLQLSPEECSDSWVCNQCSQGRHNCFVCGEEGFDVVVSALIDLFVLCGLLLLLNYVL